VVVDSRRRFGADRLRLAGGEQVVVLGAHRLQPGVSADDGGGG
jgi:hypothetical protein